MSGTLGVAIGRNLRLKIESELCICTICFSYQCYKINQKSQSDLIDKDAEESLPVDLVINMIWKQCLTRVNPVNLCFVVTPTD